MRLASEKLIECIPNFSEGRNKDTISQITAAIKQIGSIRILDQYVGLATNRTVVTFVGPPAAVQEAAFQAIKMASQLVDMRMHKGEHPRLGATDVCPFVPLTGVTLADCVQIARKVGERVGTELRIPVYLYEAAATRPERQNLANIRQGQYEGLAKKMQQPNWQPDFGPSEFNPKTGATVIGAREFLIAYNINLNTKDKKIALEIAESIRESGRLKRDSDGKISKDNKGRGMQLPGRLRSVKGIGWFIAEYGIAQVSYNITNFKLTPVHEVFEASRKEAERCGIKVTGSELVGLIPLQAMLAAGKYYQKQQNRSVAVPEEELIRIAVKSLGLDELRKFNPNKRIIEYRCFPKYGRLASARVFEFVNEVSGDWAAPGGGSVSALAGALAAALAAMVANLTLRNQSYQAVRTEMENAAVKAQRIKKELLRAIDRDAEAYQKMSGFLRANQKMVGKKAAEKAIKKAILIPVTIMDLSLQAMHLCKRVAEAGNENAISDAGVGALAGQAAVYSAFLNVKINLPQISDQQFVDEIIHKANAIQAEATILQKKITTLMETKLDK